MEKIKVLHLISSLEVGGAQKVILDLCEGMDAAKFEVIVVTMTDIVDLLPNFEEAGISVEGLSLQKSPATIWNAFKKLIQIIKSENIQIIHAHLFHAVFMSSILKWKFPHLKIVFTSHSFNMESKVREQLIKRTKGYRDADILFSDTMQSPIYRKDALIIPNGIPIENYELDVPKFPVFTFFSIGRLSVEKNHLALIDPIKEMKQKGYKVQLLIAGTGPLKEELVNAIETNDLQEHFKLLGHRKDIPTLCNQAHCFVLPSLWEGLPISLLEAAASSLPIISTDVGSIDSLVDEENGFLLADSNQLGKTMEYVFLNYEEVVRKAALLKEKMVQEFDVKATIRRHENLYQELLNKQIKRQPINSLSTVD